MVFDNVHAYDDVVAYLPSFSSQCTSHSPSPSPSSSCHVLITSRSRCWPKPPAMHELHVDERMTQMESVELLVRLMGTRKQPSLERCMQDPAYLSLATRLQHYPPAISLAGAYLSQRPEVSASAYENLFERMPLQPQLPAGDQRMNSLARALLLSLRAVAAEAQQQRLQSMGRSLLTACAYLHADSIPLALLDIWVRGEYEECPIATTRELLASTLASLCSYSLLHLDVQQQLVSMDRALQSVLRRLFPIDPIHAGNCLGSPARPARTVRERVLATVSGRRAPHEAPSDPMAADRPSLSWHERLITATLAAHHAHRASSSVYLSHLDMLQRRYYQHLAPLLRATGKPCPDAIVYALLTLGEGRRSWLYPSAKPALMRCLAEYEQLRHLHSAPAFHRLFLYLAEMSLDEGRIDGLGLIQRAHELRAALPADSVPAVDQACCLGLQQRMLTRLGRYGEALAVCEQLLPMELSLQHDSFGSQRVAQLQVSMAELHFQLQQWPQVKRRLSAALPVIERTQPNMLQLAVLRWNLFVELSRVGEEPARQVELLRGALAICSQLGDEPARIQHMRRRLQELEAELHPAPEAPSLVPSIVADQRVDVSTCQQASVFPALSVYSALA